MNYATARMVAAKHDKKIIRDAEDGRVFFEERDGTPICEVSGLYLRELTTVALEMKLGVRQPTTPEERVLVHPPASDLLGVGLYAKRVPRGD